MLNFLAKIFGRNAAKFKTLPPSRQRQLARLWVEELTPRILPCGGSMGLALGGAADGGPAGLFGSADPGSTGGAMCHHGNHGAAFTATLTDASGATGSAQYNPTTGNLTVQVTGATASSTLSVAIGGTTVGSITTNSSGDGKTTIAEASSAIAAGTAITVGDLSGTFVQVEFTASLTGTTTGEAGTAKYNVTNNVLRVSITGAADDTVYNVSVDSTVVGQLTTDATGAGKLKVTLASGITISSGTTLAIADTAGDAAILTGTFA